MTQRADSYLGGGRIKDLDLSEREGNEPGMGGKEIGSKEGGR